MLITILLVSEVTREKRLEITGRMILAKERLKRINNRQDIPYFKVKYRSTLAVCIPFAFVLEFIRLFYVVKYNNYSITKTMEFTADLIEYPEKPKYD